jgi:DNA end-binding protein Ku
MQTIWKGAVSFGLVNVPVKMYTATQDNDIPMKMLHKDFHVPIHYNRTCPKCEKEVTWSDIIKGYEYEPGHYVTFDKKELEALASEASREIRILDFVDLHEIDPIYFQKTYYLAPDESGTHAYNLLVEALRSSQKIGIANVTIRSKSSLAAIRVLDEVLSMVTMFYAEEIRPKEEIPKLPKMSKVDDRELEMAKMLIEQLTSKFEPDKYEDEYRERLMSAIESKVEGKEVKLAPQEKKSNVIDLMGALKASLQQSKQANSGDSKGSADKSAGNKTKSASEGKSTRRAKTAAKEAPENARSKSSDKTSSKSAAKSREKKTGA